VRYLILSDIHANYEALAAALGHARGRYDQIICLGDLVGYGADPNDVVEWVRNTPELRSIVRGNHDKACCGLDSIEDFNEAAQVSSIWTADALTSENLEFLRNLPGGPVDGGGFHIVHGAPADEDEYIITVQDAVQVHPYIGAAVTFFGHTHLQGGFFFRRNLAKSIEQVPRRWTELSISLDEQSTFLINPGSVGQPRDTDWRAAFAIYEPDSRLVTFYRTEYDVSEARRRILEAGLPPVLGDRLRVGK
jgi:predicted phosphodiesterase